MLEYFKEHNTKFFPKIFDDLFTEMTDFFEQVAVKIKTGEDLFFVHHPFFLQNCCQFNKFFTNVASFFVFSSFCILFYGQLGERYILKMATLLPPCPT